MEHELFHIDYEEQFEAAININIGRIFWDRLNPFDIYGENEFRDRYRLSRNSVIELFELLVPRLPNYADDRGLPITKEHQVSN